MQPEELKKEEPREENTMDQKLKEMVVARKYINQINETVGVVKSLLDTIISQYNITDKILEHLLLINDDDIMQMSSDDIQDFLKAHDNDPYAIESAYLKADDKSETKLEFSRNALKGIKEVYANYVDILNQKAEFIQEAKKIQDDYENYRHSEAYKNNMALQIEEVKKKIASIDSEYLKKKLTEELNVLETSHECKFLLDRFSEVDPEKEIESVEKIFFNDRLSANLMERFYKKSQKFNISRKLYKTFFSLEEKYLPEEYHPYNNFFLFYITRYIVHADTSDKKDKNRVEAIIMKLIKLTQGKLTEEEKTEFLKVIKKFYLYIINDERTAKFKEKNITYKKNEYRVSRHNELIEALKKELGPTYDESYDEYSDDEIRETLATLNQSDILMTKHVYRVTKDMKWLNEAHPFYVVKEEYDRIKEEERLEEEKKQLEKEADVVGDEIESMDVDVDVGASASSGFTFNNAPTE